MPLRDHFRSPVKDRHKWESVHGGWPMIIVQQLFDILPEGYESDPTARIGTYFEIDVSTYKVGKLKHNGSLNGQSARTRDGGGVATAIAPEPTLTLETDLSEQDEFEVKIYDDCRQLVAAIEIVSPANKDRPETRRDFVAKVAALLQKGVCVSIVDLVTIRQFNLYSDLLELIGRADPKLDQTLPPLYSVTLRSRKQHDKGSLLDVWYYPMTVGQTLPTLPIWLDVDRRILLPLESSYEETCRLLHIA